MSREHCFSEIYQQGTVFYGNIPVWNSVLPGIYQYGTGFYRNISAWNSVVPEYISREQCSPKYISMKKYFTGIYQQGAVFIGINQRTLPEYGTWNRIVPEYISLEQGFTGI